MASVEEVLIHFKGKNDVTPIQNQISSGMNNVQKTTGTATSTLGKMGEAGKTAFSSLKSSLSTFMEGMSGLQGAIAGVIGSFGAMEVAQMAVTGAMDRQMNEQLLTLKFGASESRRIVNDIQNIVADLPGDDTFMNQMLSLASYKGGIGDSGMLATLGQVTAGYTIASSHFNPGLEKFAQMELKDYILTGNVSLMQRDGLLREHVDKLQEAETIEERITLLNQILNDEGYMQLANLDNTAIRWEIVKGKIQMAATTLGTFILPIIEAVLGFLVDMDEATGGWSSQLILVGVTVGGIVGSLGLLKSVISPGIQLFKDMAGGARTVLEKLDLISKADCNKTCVTKQVSECVTGGAAGSGGKGGKWYTKLPGYGLASAGLAGGGYGGAVGAGISIGTTLGLGLLGGAVVGAIDSTVVRPIANYLSTDLKGLGGQAIGGIFRMPSRFFGGGSYDGPFGTRETAKGLGADLESGNYLGFLTKTGPLGAVRGTLEDITGGLKDLMNTLSMINWGNLMSGLEPITSLLGRVSGGIKPFIDIAKQLICVIIGCSPGIIPSLKQLRSALSNFKFELPSLAPVINFFKQIPAKAWDFLSQLPGIVTTTFWSAVGNARSGAQQIYSGVKSYVSQIPGMVYNEFMSIAQRIMDTLGSLYDSAYQAGQNILSGIRDATGISSPGYIYYMIQGELSNVLGVMDEYRQPFARGAYNLGASLVNNMTPLGNPNLPGQYGASAGAGVTIHYHQETIDARNWSKEELMAMLYTIYQGGTGG